jgi:hypothetical protein
MNEEQYPHAVSVPIILEGFPYDLDGAWIYHEFENYAIGGEITFKKDYSYLAGGWVFSTDKEFLDNLEYLVVEWSEEIRNSIIK